MLALVMLELFIASCFDNREDKTGGLERWGQRCRTRKSINPFFYDVPI
jgi:hypothetical protein